MVRHYPGIVLPPLIRLQAVRQTFRLARKTAILECCLEAPAQGLLTTRITRTVISGQFRLYAGPGAGDAVSTLVPVSGTVAHFFTDSAVEGYPGSWFSDVPATISTSTTGTTTLGGATVAPFGVAVGSQATLAIAAWYNGNGAYTSYAAAVAAGQPAGVSTTGSENLGGNQWVPPDLPAPGGGSHMVGFDADVSGGITSFSLSAGNSSLLSPVPEPGTMALGVIGAAAFLMRLRRK